MSSGLSLVTPPRVDDSPLPRYDFDRADEASDGHLANDFLQVKNFNELSTVSPDKRSFSVSFGKCNDPQPQFRKRSDSHYRKRKYSFGSNGDQKHVNPKRRKDVRRVLPTKFLLGGNISDPLNLSSLANGANQVTPQSSPLPTPRHRAQVEVLIPANYNDPLNLYSNEDVDESSLISPKIKHKSRKRKRKRTDSETTVDHEVEVTVPPNNDIASDTKKPLEPIKHQKPRFNDGLKSVDKIVSPVIPQGSGNKHRRHTDHSKPTELETVDHKHQKETKVFRRKSKKNQSKQTYNFRTNDDKFRYGNYNRYYGYRNFHQKDCRLDSFKRDWFDAKDVLDIGCNVGHITLFIAKNFDPNSVIGLDIDNDLIRTANKNVRHYITSNVVQTQDFPISLPLFHGPLASTGEANAKFPNNVCFISGNYVSDSQESCDVHKQQFDTILCLSLTKWVHLNWGDGGVKTLFKRIFSQLRPNGRLILEAQPFCSYKKKKKINETLLENFRSIQFRPEQFNEYLLSREIGFSQSELVGTPANPSKGFRRPIYVFTKSGITLEKE